MPLTGAFVLPHPPIAVPEIGGGREEEIIDTLKAFDAAALRISELKPDTIIVTSPHQVMYTDYFHISPGRSARGNFGSFGCPDVKMEFSYDTDIVKEIVSRAQKIGLPVGTDGERDKNLDHGTMVPLYFVNKRYTGFRIVRIGLSGCSLEIHKALGRIIGDVCEQSDKRIVIIASGDLSHCQKEDGPYGFKPEGPAYDKRLMEVMKKGDLDDLMYFSEDLLYESQECGHRSFVILSGALQGRDYKTKVLSHEATFGVGYGIVSIDTGNIISKRSEDPYVRLAYETVINHVKGMDVDVHSASPSELTGKRAGVFVSIHECGMLRGCIGTIVPTCENIEKEIIRNAIAASSEDPRFDPITEDELSALEINVDVLSPAEPIASKDELDVKRYGVIVESGYKRGLLLPDLEGVDSVEEQIMIARRKAGILPDENIRLSRFEVIRHI